MKTKTFFIYFLIILITAHPVSAGEVSLTRWVLNVTLHEDGTVEELIQAEIDNGGSSPLEGISFVVPAQNVTMIYDFEHTSSFTGQVVEQQNVAGGVKITLSFNRSVEPGKKWNGRIGFKAENWAVKDGSNYSIDIPVAAPQAIVSGKSTAIAVPAGADIRSQVFLPKSVEVTYVKPDPFRVLFQFNRMVPTWSPDKIHTGDVIRIKGSHSGTLNKIIENDERIKKISSLIKESKDQGKDASEAEGHLKLAIDYNNNQALQGFYKKNYSNALEFTGYANEELDKAEKSLPAGEKTDVRNTSGTPRTTPAPGVPALIVVLVITFLGKSKNKRS